MNRNGLSKTSFSANALAVERTAAGAESRYLGFGDRAPGRLSPLNDARIHMTIGQEQMG